MTEPRSATDAVLGVVDPSVLLPLVVALGPGLGDASGRIGLGRNAPRGMPAGTDAAPVAWPAPGGEVPACHPSPEESKA